MERFKPDDKKDHFDDIRMIRTSLLDSNIINLMKREKIRENADFLNSKREFADIPLDKTKYGEEEKKNTTQNSKDKPVNPTQNSTLGKKISLEELEKIISAKIAL